MNFPNTFIILRLLPSDFKKSSEEKDSYKFKDNELSAYKYALKY